MGDDAQSIYSFRGPRSRISSRSRRIFPTPWSSSWSRTTARPAPSSMRPTR
ncbi:MAG: hypothetical protein ACLU5I_01130 [Alistipes finegoldii]